MTTRTVKIEAAEATPRAPIWRTLSSKHIAVLAPEGSYALKQAPNELRQAVRILGALSRLLEPGEAKEKETDLRIYLTDPVAAPEDGLHGGDGYGQERPDAGQGAVLRVVQPDAPGEPLSRAVTERLIALWFSRDAAGSKLFVDGIAGVVDARLGTGASVKEADEWVRGELTEKRDVSVFSPPTSGERVGWERTATSFVAYLLHSYGAGALRRFLTEFDPQRRDHSATAVYERPLGKLEEGWIAAVRKSASHRGSYGPFFRQIVPLLKPYWPRQLEIFAYLLFSLAYGLALPLASAYLIDTILPRGSVEQLVTFIGILTFLYVLSAAIAMRRTYAYSWLNQRILMNLQEKMFRHLQELGHNYHGRAKVGDIMIRLGSDLAIVQGAISALVNSGLYMTLSAIGAAIALFLLSPLLATLVVVVVPVFTIAYLTLRTRLQKASAERQKLASEVTSGVQENLLAHAVVKAFGLRESALRQYRARLLAQFKALLRLVVISSLFDTSTSLAITLGHLVILGVGGYLVMTGGLTLGVLMAFIGLMPSLFTPVGALAALGQTIETASASMERVNELLDEPVNVAEKEDAAALPPLSREIRLEKVRFSYGGERAILKELDLTIPAGANVAIVGPSGSGKSTIINLLMRFWDPDEGRVTFDGHDLRDVTVDSLRGQIGLVFQDTFVFDTTMRENIGLSKPGATDEEIAAAARAARLDSYIETLPAGFDTVLGERGVRMSGGQRQRLAIARALLRDPRILILDEATSALDAQTEREILDTLASVVRGRTTISITHRLSLAALADTIYVLKEGQLVEEGPHAELVRAGGLYQRLYDEQTGHVTAAGAPRTGIDVERLHDIPLFSALGAGSLASLANQLVLERYGPGIDVVKQGDEGDKLYIINRGQVDIVVSDWVGERRANTLNEGDYFGEMALLAGEPRTATVRTTTLTELYSLDQRDFKLLLDREPEFRKGVMETVAARRAALASLRTQLPAGAVTEAVPA
jgi:ABC-type multidrug transport system fused ATPase/permease subunit